MMSYRLMLDFYGLQLQDECTGALQRSPVRVGSISMSPRALTPPTRPTQCFRERMQAAIVRSSHNHLRLARIMSSLSVLGFRPHALELLHRLRREVRCVRLSSRIARLVNRVCGCHRQVQRGALRSLQRGRALAMWSTYEDADTPGFAQYCMVLCQRCYRVKKSLSYPHACCDFVPGDTSGARGYFCLPGGVANGEVAQVDAARHRWQGG